MMAKYDSLVDMIFRGETASVNLGFLTHLLAEAKKVYFNYPEVSSIVSFDSVVEIFKVYSEVDLVIVTDKLSILEKAVPNVFFNLGRINNEIDILIFFDLKDLKAPTIKESVDILRKWAAYFKSEYGFNYFICETDNNYKEECYFDIIGVGKLYRELKC